MKRKIFSTTMLVIMLLLSSCNSSLFSKCRKEKSLDYQYVGLYINFVDEKTKTLDDSNVKIYIDKNYNENISLKSIAEAVNANQYYLSHIFKEETGFSPMQYVTRRRIGEAQNLLINTQLSITEIAANVGYNNSNYFQNVFKKIVGYTPGSYRKRWQV